MQFLKHNWFFKLLSLAAAVVLALFVNKQEDTAQRTMYRDIVIEARQGQQVAEPRGGLQVTIDMEGPRELIRAIENEDVQVNLDTDTVPAGKRVSVPVEVLLPEKYKSRINVDWRPRSVQVRLISDTSRVADVVVKPLNPPEGWEFTETPRANPARVTVSGPKEAVDAVTSVIAPFNMEPMERLSTTATLQALNSRNEVVTDLVRLEPRQVLVTGNLEPVALQRRVPVQPILTPPPGMRLTVTVSPAQVRVVGPKRALNNLYVIETAPISLPPGPGQVVRDVPLQMLPDLVEVSPTRVRVTVKAQPAGARPPK